MPSFAIQWQKELMKMVEFWNVLLCKTKNTSTFSLQSKQHTHTHTYTLHEYALAEKKVSCDILNLNISQVVLFQYPSRIYYGRNPTKNQSGWCCANKNKRKFDPFWSCFCSSYSCKLSTVPYLFSIWPCRKRPQRFAEIPSNVVTSNAGWEWLGIRVMGTWTSYIFWNTHSFKLYL